MPRLQKQAGVSDASAPRRRKKASGCSSPARGRCGARRPGAALKRSRRDPPRLSAEAGVRGARLR
eukprot:1823897-Lingulodinium_polyedra.AAC.1